MYGRESAAAATSSSGSCISFWVSIFLAQSPTWPRTYVTPNPNQKLKSKIMHYRRASRELLFMYFRLEKKKYISDFALKIPNEIKFVQGWKKDESISCIPVRACINRKKNDSPECGKQEKEKSTFPRNRKHFSCFCIFGVEWA